MHAQTRKPLLTVHRRDAGDDALDMIPRGCKVDVGRYGPHAEPGTVTHGLRRLGAGKQGLGGDAARVQAISSHLATLDQDHPRAHLHGSGGQRQAA